MQDQDLFFRHGTAQLVCKSRDLYRIRMVNIDVYQHHDKSYVDERVCPSCLREIDIILKSERNLQFTKMFAAVFAILIMAVITYLILNPDGGLLIASTVPLILGISFIFSLNLKGMEVSEKLMLNHFSHEVKDVQMD